MIAKLNVHLNMKTMQLKKLSRVKKIPGFRKRKSKTKAKSGILTAVMKM